MGSNRTFLTIAMAAVALAVPSVAAAQETGTRIVVIGAMQETGTRIIVTGATRDRADVQRAEDPADRAIPALPVVYEDEAPAPVQAPTTPAPTRR